MKRIISRRSLSSLIWAAFTHQNAENSRGDGSNHFDDEFPSRHVVFTHGMLILGLIHGIEKVCTKGWNRCLVSAGRRYAATACARRGLFARLFYLVVGQLSHLAAMQ